MKLFLGKTGKFGIGPLGEGTSWRMSVPQKWLVMILENKLVKRGKGARASSLSTLLKLFEDRGYVRENFHLGIENFEVDNRTDPDVIKMEIETRGKDASFLAKSLMAFKTKEDGLVEEFVKSGAITIVCVLIEGKKRKSAVIQKKGNDVGITYI